MTRDEFKTKWHSGEKGGSITIEDICNCAKEWGLEFKSSSSDIIEVVLSVLRECDISPGYFMKLFEEV